MGRVRQRGTTPELAVRAALRELGLRYRVNARDLPGSPDIVNRSKRIAIFVHGCYWHRYTGATGTAILIAA
jgi:DNA mismatch endonuclease, patch repair protein